MLLEFLTAQGVVAKNLHTEVAPVDVHALASAMAKSGLMFCIACHHDLASSRGTRSMVEQCLKHDVPVWLIDGEGAEPKRLKALSV